MAVLQLNEVEFNAVKQALLVRKTKKLMADSWLLTAITRLQKLPDHIRRNL